MLILDRETVLGHELALITSFNGTYTECEFLPWLSTLQTLREINHVVANLV